MAVASGFNYSVPQSITFSTLVLNGQTIVGSPFLLQEEGFFAGKLDGVDVQFALVNGLQLNYEKIEFTGSEDPFWRAAQANMPDANIWDHSAGAYPLFWEGIYRIVFFVDKPCFVSLHVDEKFAGKMAVPSAGRNAFTGVKMSRGRHHIELIPEFGL